MLKAKILHVFINPIFQLFIVLLFSTIFGSIISENAVRFFLTISIFIREILIFILPVSIFCFISISFARANKILRVISLLVIIVFSGLFHVFLSALIGYSFLSSIQKQVIQSSIEIQPLIHIHFFKIIDNVTALILGALVGNLIYYFKLNKTYKVILCFRDIIIKFINKFIVPLLPIFITGFLLKLLRENVILEIIMVNSEVFLKIIFVILLYFFTVLMLCSGLNFKKFAFYLKNIFPAVLTGFATISSDAAFPLIQNAAKKNTNNEILSDAVVPLALNFHLVGDILLIPIMCMTVLLAFDAPLPTLYEFFKFAIFLVLYQFAGAGVPNVTILVLIPYLMKYWGFSDAMAEFAIAFYAIIEPLSTAGNVFANSLLVIAIQKILYGKCRV